MIVVTIDLYGLIKISELSIKDHWSRTYSAHYIFLFFLGSITVPLNDLFIHFIYHFEIISSKILEKVSSKSGWYTAFTFFYLVTNFMDVKVKFRILLPPKLTFINFDSAKVPSGYLSYRRHCSELLVKRYPVLRVILLSSINREADSVSRRNSYDPPWLTKVIIEEWVND